VKQAHIYIHGNIGSYIDPSGKEVKGVELLDVIQQVKANSGASSYLFHIKSPGGLVDTGDQIYDYMVSLKGSAKVDTVTDGDVGSIATKLFLAGDERMISEGHEFFIHNPWTQPQPGDSVKLNIELAALKQTESKLRGFYMEKTGITEQGLSGLMDNETAMTADQAVTLGFATKKVAASKVKTFALIKNQNTMPETFGAKIGALVDAMLGNKPVVQANILALDLELEGGKKISTNAADEASLVGSDAMVTAEDGTAQPAPDGEHKLADGRIVVVTGGKVAEVKPAQAAAAPTSTPAPAAAAPAPVQNNDALLAELAAVKAELAAMKAQPPVAEQINAAIDGLKASLTSGQAPVRAFNNTGNPAPAKQMNSINQKMAEGREKRKQELNNK
jgi:ATP-dependent protease ClpP protease subunit